MAKTAIMLKNAGKTLDTDHLKKMYHDLKPIGVSVAAVGQVEDGSLQIAIDKTPSIKTSIGETWEEFLAAMQEFQNTLKDEQALFIFTDDPGAIEKVGTAEDGTDIHDAPYMQPYEIITEDNDSVHLICALAGDFSKHTEKNSKHPAEFFCVQKEIAPRIIDLAGTVGEDIDKITAGMDTNTFKKDVLGTASGDAIVVFLSSNGNIPVFQTKAGMMAEHPWGWSTFIPKVDAKAAPATPKAGTGKFKLGLKLGALTGKKTKAEDQPVDPKPQETHVPGGKPDTETAVPLKDGDKLTPGLVLKDGKMFATCPKHITTKDDIRNWYEANAGYKPQGYRNYPTVEVKAGLNNLDQVQAARDSIKVTSTKTGETKTDKGDAKQGPVGTPTPPIIPAEQRTEILKDAITLKLLDKNSQVIPTKDQLDEIEKKFSTFSEQFGGKLELKNFVGITFDEFLDWAGKYPEAHAVLTMNLLWAYARTLKAGTKAVETTDTSTKVTTSGASKFKFGGVGRKAG